jgi:hypothetical protein
MASGISIGTKDSIYLDFPRGRNILIKYNEDIARYKDKTRQTLSNFYLGDNNTLIGSSSFMNVQLGSLVNLATPTELELAVEKKPDFFEYQYEDIALVLRSSGDSYAPNDFVAKSLAEQIKKRLGTIPTPEKPVRISLKGLSLKEDLNSSYGLVFVVGDVADIITVPEFSYVNDRKCFEKTDERGVPIFNSKGNRTFYARDNGLSWLCLGWDLDLRSSNGNLAKSSSIGRVPIIMSS